MDILKAEIERKRKELDSVSKGAKYFKRSILETVEIEEEKVVQVPTANSEGVPTAKLEKNEFYIPLEEIIKRFRAKNEPIKLYDETDASRLKRLAKIESRDESFVGQRNDYLGFLDANEEESQIKKIYGGNLTVNAKLKDIDRTEFDTTRINLDNFNQDALNVCKLIAVYFKRIVRDWEVFLENRPQDEKRSQDGKRAAGNCSQAKEYLKPFYKKLRKQQIDEDILVKIIEICEYMQIREYQKANDIYLRLSIGNAAWPIGISGTSIHERSALERIETSKSAGHVLNDEVILNIYLKLQDYKKVDSKY